MLLCYIGNLNLICDHNQRPGQFNLASLVNAENALDALAKALDDKLGPNEVSWFAVSTAWLKLVLHTWKKG